MIEQLWEQGIKEGLGIFFFLFLVMGTFFGYVVREVVRTNREAMKQNNQREERYIVTIDNLAKSLTNVEEFRKENQKEHEDTQRMISVVLDRIDKRVDGRV